LGDSVLSAVVAKSIYQAYPERTEADLTLYKIALVRAENLAMVAQEIGLDKVILLGNGEEKNNGRAKTTILCDCLEGLL
jgi:ribonuclease-3